MHVRNTETLQYKDVSYQYRNLPHKDATVPWPFYSYNWKPCTWIFGLHVEPWRGRPAPNLCIPVPAANIICFIVGQGYIWLYCTHCLAIYRGIFLQFSVAFYDLKIRIEIGDIMLLRDITLLSNHIVNVIHLKETFHQVSWTEISTYVKMYIQFRFVYTQGVMESRLS